MTLITTISKEHVANAGDPYSIAEDILGTANQWECHIIGHSWTKDENPLLVLELDKKGGQWQSEYFDDETQLGNMTNYIALGFGLTYELDLAQWCDIREVAKIVTSVR